MNIFRYVRLHCGISFGSNCGIIGIGVILFFESLVCCDRVLDSKAIGSSRHMSPELVCHQENCLICEMCPKFVQTALNTARLARRVQRPARPGPTANKKSCL